MRSLSLLLSTTLALACAAQDDPPVAAPPAAPLLMLRCGAGGAWLQRDGEPSLEALLEDQGLPLGDGLQAAGALALEVVDPEATPGESTWIWMAPGASLRMQGRRPRPAEGAEDPEPPGLDLVLRHGRILVCRRRTPDAGPGRTLVVTTLDGSVRLDEGSAVIDVGEAYGDATVTALRGSVATARWGKAFELARPVPAGFRRSIGEVSAKAGEAYLWKVDPVQFLGTFGLGASCGPTGEECRGDWKSRPRPQGWFESLR